MKITKTLQLDITAAAQSTVAIDLGLRSGYIAVPMAIAFAVHSDTHAGALNVGMIASVGNIAPTVGEGLTDNQKVLVSNITPKTNTHSAGINIVLEDNPHVYENYDVGSLYLGNDIVFALESYHGIVASGGVHSVTLFLDYEEKKETTSSCSMIASSIR